MGLFQEWQLRRERLGFDLQCSSRAPVEAVRCEVDLRLSRIGRLDLLLRSFFFGFTFFKFQTDSVSVGCNRLSQTKGRMDASRKKRRVYLLFGSGGGGHKASAEAFNTVCEQV